MTKKIRYTDALDVSHSSYKPYNFGAEAVLYELFLKGQKESTLLIRVLPFAPTDKISDSGMNIMKLQPIDNKHFTKIYEHGYRVVKNGVYEKKLQITDTFIEAKNGEEFFTYYQVIEKIEGKSLQQMICDCKNQNAKLPDHIHYIVQRDLPMIHQALMEAKIVHNDMHPHNLMVKDNKTLVCLDFEYSKSFKRARPEFYHLVKRDILYSIRGLISLHKLDPDPETQHNEYYALTFLSLLFPMKNSSSIQELKGQILQYQEIAVEDFFSIKLLYPLLKLLIRHKKKLNESINPVMTFEEIAKTPLYQSSFLQKKIAESLVAIYRRLQGSKRGAPILSYDFKHDTICEIATSKVQDDCERFFSLLLQGLTVERGEEKRDKKDLLPIFCDLIRENFTQIRGDPKEWLIKKCIEKKHLFITKKSTLVPEIQEKLDAFHLEESLKRFFVAETIQALLGEL